MTHPARATGLARPAASLAIVAILGSVILAAPNSHWAWHPRSLTSALVAVEQDAPQPIYSDDPNDPWNRIFYCLFTRRLQTRFSDEFPDATPFMAFGEFFRFRISTRTFDRIESGDRPIDPLYSPPAFSEQGSRQLLTEPRYSMLVAALQEASTDPSPRSPLARALLQSDLWSAYDILYWRLFPQDRGTSLDAHKQTISGLLAALIKKLALTPQEIQSLPTNYVAARDRDSLPDLFSLGSDWIELHWIPARLHDEQASNRRVSRIFVKPTHPPQDKQKFLNSLRDLHGISSAGLGGAVILIQPLLIDSRGRIVPSRLVTDVEIRRFQWSVAGAFQKTDVHTYGLRRRLMLHDPGTGGLDAEDENSPVYLSDGGSYGFAEPVSPGPPSGTDPHSPVVVKLRSRCALCHGADLTSLMTFEIALPPKSAPPPVKQFDPTSHQAADYDISQKSKRAEWKALHACFTSTAAQLN